MSHGVVVIGAGPYGLSISAHLRELGVDHVAVGRPMESWRARMPAGMLLKSEPYASAIASPGSGYDLAGYCRSHGLDYVNRVGPVPVERFIAYGDWYAKQLVPHLQDVRAKQILPTDGGFRVVLDDAPPVLARQVVVATGVIPHAYLPDELSSLPSDLVTHAADHHELGQFSGRTVAVVGGGQSALETAALLHEAGADVRVITRGPVVQWNGPNPAHRTLKRRIRWPVTQLCEGWHCVLWNTPTAFRRLPESTRITKARTVLGPSGAWWLKDRVDGVIEILTGRSIRTAAPHGNRVRLTLDGANPLSIDVDHVIAGTGYRIDLSRLPFIPDGLRDRIETVSGYPVVSRAGQSSVPGLYFAGAPTAVSLGPSARFVAGTHNAAKPLVLSVARRARLRSDRRPAPDAPTEAQLSYADAMEEAR